MKTFYIYRGKKITDGISAVAENRLSHVILIPHENGYYHLLENIPENQEHIVFLTLKGDIVFKVELNMDFLAGENYYRIDKWFD